MNDLELLQPDPDLRRSRLAPLLLRAYALRSLRSICINLALRLERGEFHSATLRSILAHYHGVRIGAYSYGPCLTPGLFPAGVTIGRYVSIAHGVRILLRNHPMDRPSMHPFFFNSRLGYIAQDTAPPSRLWIGHDAWIGENAIITPSCHRIGIGAVVGAGAVVTRDVPDFAVVAGNPAALIRYRFPDDTAAHLRRQRFWEHPPHILRDMMSAFDPNAPHETLHNTRAAA
jgi:virginiamycin A acetyltransferase